jgi:hypothetical protein
VAKFHASRHCEERSDEAIQFFLWRRGLLRGVYHRARIRATRWLAMTMSFISTDLPDGQISSIAGHPACPAPFEKIFWFSEIQISPIVSPSCPTEGRLEIVTDAGQDAVDADGANDESA